MKTRQECLIVANNCYSLNTDHGLLVLDLLSQLKRLMLMSEDTGYLTLASSARDMLDLVVLK